MEQKEEQGLRGRLEAAKAKYKSAPVTGRALVGPYVEPLIDLLGAVVEELEKREGKG